METKLIIFVVFANLAQSALGVLSPNSSVVIAHRAISDGLHKVGVSAYSKAIDIIFNDIKKYLHVLPLDDQNGIDYDTIGHTMEPSKREVFTALIVTLDSALDAIIINDAKAFPKMVAGRTTIYPLVEQIAGGIYRAMQLACGTNFSAASEEIERIKEAAAAGCVNLTAAYFDIIRNGQAIDDEDEAALQTAQNGVASAMANGARGVFDAIEIFGAAVSARTEIARENAIPQLETTQIGVSFALQSELAIKYAYIQSHLPAGSPIRTE